MRNIRLLVTQTHRPDESLVLHRPSRELRPDERRLGDHPLPTLLPRLFTGLDDLEHLILGDSLDSRQRHRELGGLLSTLLLDGGGERFRGVGLLTVEQVRREGLGGGLGRRGRLERFLLVRFERLLELDLLVVALLGVEFRAEAVEVLRIFGGFVAFTCGALAPGCGVRSGAVRRRTGVRTCAPRNLVCVHS